MKYTTKRSKVEEVTIDLEDGCILKVTKDNVNLFDFSESYIGERSLNYERSSIFSHYEVNLSFTNGILYTVKTLDKALYDDLFSLLNGK
ncbi:MAG: hypothetical protein RSB94_07835 [Erysipelotrichaceae bacterium]